MKRIILSLSLLVAIGMSVAFANADPEVNEKVKESFEKQFSGAKLVTWAESGEYLRASFVLGDHRAVAYFSQDGRLEGCARDLFYGQLPMLVTTSIDKRYSGSSIIDVTEIVNTEGTTYRVTLEYKNKKYRVKADPTGNIVDTQKLK